MRSDFGHDLCSPSAQSRWVKPACKALTVTLMMLSSRPFLPRLLLAVPRPYATCDFVSSQQGGHQEEKGWHGTHGGNLVAVVELHRGECRVVEVVVPQNGVLQAIRPFLLRARNRAQGRCAER